MTRLLLDTHVLLWALFEPHKLPDSLRALLARPDNVRLVSAATAWEIATKYRLGRLPHALPLVQSYSDHLARFQATELPVGSRHALVAGGFSQAHRDPFDRILAAQSLLEGVPLVTADPAFQAFPAQVLW